MKIRFLFIALFYLFPLLLLSQEVERKSLTAIRISEVINIDGQLDEAVYARVVPATDFVQLNPYNGQPSYKASEVKVLYDDNALYFAAMLYDHPDSIASYITTRDNIGSSDYFVVMLDPNNEGLLAYEFIVTPANSQTDLKGVRSNNGDNEDSSWNAVWQSATQITDEGWTAEIRIPYSALRFAAEENPVWGLNFFRRIRRYNSNNSWNFVNFKISGFLHQTGQLFGLQDIKPPVRLSVSPYIAEYVEMKTGSEKPDFLLKGGLDLKYGISESHTLDMMLIPDFGQIQSDDEELNLSPYEIQYDEKRQFFNEGGELFGRADLFYSRRIGGHPVFAGEVEEQLKEHEKISYNPASAQMINATKISGRGKSGWGVGFLNAMTLPSYARVEDTLSGGSREIMTQPFTNFNVSVIEKSMNNNSYVSLINTNLSMVDHNYSANATATQFMLKNKNQSHQFSGVAGMSYKPTADDPAGYGYTLDLSKIKGNFRYSAGRGVLSNTLDFNDMGYMQRNNIIEHEVELSYHIFDPFLIFKNWSSQIWWENTRLFEPRHAIDSEVNFWTDATFKNNWWMGVYYGYNFGSHDFFEPRSTNNRYYKGPAVHSGEINLNSDHNKKLAWSYNGGLYQTEEKGRWGSWQNTGLWLKASQRFNINYDLSLRNEINAKGYVDDFGNDSIYFGTYDRNTLVNTISLGYAFNTKTSLDFRARHYWSKADYDAQYYLLQSDGTLLADDGCTTAADVNFNAFNIDMIFTWEFAPGSELSLAWKNAIYTSEDEVGISAGENWSRLFSADKINNLSLKILYYIDYGTVKSKLTASK